MTTETQKIFFPFSGVGIRKRFCPHSKGLVLPAKVFVATLKGLIQLPRDDFITAFV